MAANYFTILYWFCHTSTCICHKYTCVPHPEHPSLSLPILSLWVVPVHQPQASSIMHWTWAGDSFHIWYYTCFNAILQNHPTLSLSLRVQTSVITKLWGVFANSARCLETVNPINRYRFWVMERSHNSFQLMGVGGRNGSRTRLLWDPHVMLQKETGFRH